MSAPPTWFVPPAVEPSWISRPLRGIGDGDSTELRFPAVDPAGLEELLSHLESAGEALASRSLDDVMDSIAQTAAMFSAPSSVVRRQAIDLLAQTTGRAAPMVGDTLDAFLDKLAVPRLHETVAAAVGDPAALDGFVATTANRRRRAVGPGLTFHVLAGNTPWAGVESLVAALLARSASLVKLSSEEPVFAGLFARTLAEIDPEIGSALAVLYWPGGEEEIEDDALTRADAVVAFGDNTTVAALWQRVAARNVAGRVRFIPRGHRASVALIGVDALSDETAARTIAAHLAEDFALEDQEGCLSPHAAYLETSSTGSPPTVDPERFAALLGEGLESCEERWPRRKVTAEEAVRIQAARATAELRGATVLAPEGSTRWTVLLDPRVEFEVAPLHRYAVLHPVETIDQAVRGLEPACGMLSTISIAGFGERRDRALAKLANLRPGRICSVGEMQRPPAGWNHDGISDLAALLSWVECEEEKA